MPEYNYICQGCNREYKETRLSTDPQWATICSCGGNFVEDNSSTE